MPICDGLLGLARDGVVNGVAELLKEGCNPNMKDKDGDTPLQHEVVYYGYVDATRLLLERGADLSIKNRNGEVPLDIAKEADILIC